MAGGVWEGQRTGVLIVALAAVMAAIAVFWNLARHAPHRAPPPIENIEGTAAVAPAGETPEPEPAPAVSPAPATERLESARNRAQVARVIKDGRPDLKAC